MQDASDENDGDDDDSDEMKVMVTMTMAMRRIIMTSGDDDDDGDEKKSASRDVSRHMAWLRAPYSYFSIFRADVPQTSTLARGKYTAT